MRLVYRLLVFLLVLMSALCLLTWASWFDPNLDFVGLAKYARRFPMGPDKGPLIGVFGCLAFAYVVDANTPETDRRH